MFENKITILNGERASGKTTLLKSITETFLQLNIPFYFLDVLGDSSYLKQLHSGLNYDKLTHSKQNIDYQISKLREKIKSEAIQFLIIDDSDNIESKIIEKLLSLDCKIILTSSVISEYRLLFRNANSIQKLLPNFKKRYDYQIINLKSNYSDSNLKVENVVEIDGIDYHLEEVKSLILSKFRDKKIDSILREEKKINILNKIL